MANAAVRAAGLRSVARGSGCTMTGWHLGMLASGRSVAAELAIISLAIVIGLAVGRLRLGSFRLGLSGVLFSALLFGQLGFVIEAKALEFLRDFALITFMYAIGL